MVLMMKIWWYRFQYNGEGDYQKYDFYNGGSKINFWIITPTGQRPSESFLVFLMIVKTKCSSFPFMLMMLLPTHGEDQQTPQTISQRWDDDDDDARARWSLGLRNNLLVFWRWLLYIIMPYSIYSGLIVQIWSKASKYIWQLVTRVERDHLHSVIQSSRDRTNPGNNTFARTYKFLQHKVYKAVQDFPRLTKDQQ